MIKLVVLMGEAGSGKDTIVKQVVQQHPTIFHQMVSSTTRSPREGEVDGVDYHFLTEEEFNDKIKNGKMLEHTIFNNWYYGSNIDDLSRDKVNIAVFNPTGVRAIMQRDDIELTVYYVQAGDKVRLIRQLNREENPDIEEILRRFAADKKDFEVLDDIDYILLVNVTKANINTCVKKILGNIH